MSSEVCLAANQQGTFRLAVLDSEVVGDASWSNLEMPRVQGRLPRSATDTAGRDAPADTSPRDFHEVRLSMRALQNVLSSAPLAKSTIACLCADYCIVLYVYLTGQQEPSANNSATGVLNVRVNVPIGCLNSVHRRRRRLRRLNLLIPIWPCSRSPSTRCLSVAAIFRVVTRSARSSCLDPHHLSPSANQRRPRNRGTACTA